MPSPKRARHDDGGGSERKKTRVAASASEPHIRSAPSLPAPASAPAPAPSSATAGPSTPSIRRAKGATSTPTASPSQRTKRNAPDSFHSIPGMPLLYHTALEAHHAAARHYQQAFVPLGAAVPETSAIPLYWDGREGAYAHDAYAGHTALRLLVLALDLLSLGLSQKGLSDKERVAFSLEFATVGIKLAAAATVLGQMRAELRAAYGIQINLARVYADLETVLAKSLVIARRSPYLKSYANDLTLASARLAVMRDKGSRARQIIKQALADSAREEYQHRYSLYLLFMAFLRDTNNAEFFRVAADLEAEAEAAGHTQVVQIVHMARLTGHFCLRKWDNLGDALQRAARVLGVDPGPAIECEAVPFLANLHIHYHHFRTLHASRIGDPEATKAGLKAVFDLMDDASERGILNQQRANGGVLRIRLPSPSGPTQYIYIQTTHVNMLHSLTYLNSLVSRRNLFLSNDKCRALVHADAMREYELVARVDDMWDSGFSPMQGIGHAVELRLTFMMLRLGTMMEQALAYICRSDFKEADKILTETVALLRACNLFHLLSPQVSLLYAQFAHYLGRPEIAKRYYRAAKYTLVPGSELRALVDIGLLGAEDNLSDLLNDHDRATEVNILADMCRSGSNAQMHAVGNFLSSLTDSERISSKRKLAEAYSVVRKADHNMLYTLIFAFTTGSAQYGDRERQLKQLKTGRHLARSLGGEDREDRVGQATLGLWYIRKLREHYRLDGKYEEEAAAKVEEETCVARLKEIYAYSLTRFPPVEAGDE